MGAFVTSSPSNRGGTPKGRGRVSLNLSPYLLYLAYSAFLFISFLPSSRIFPQAGKWCPAGGNVFSRLRDCAHPPVVQRMTPSRISDNSSWRHGFTIARSLTFPRKKSFCVVTTRSYLLICCHFWRNFQNFLSLFGHFYHLLSLFYHRLTSLFSL